MKYRSDFVTNSSSSSFIVCFEEGLKADEVEAHVRSVLENLIDIDCDEEEAVEEIMNRLYWWPTKYGVRLNGVIAFGCEVGNEDGPGGALLYDYGSRFANDKIKVGSFS